MDHVRYPIGNFEPITRLSAEQRKGLTNQIAGLTGTLRDLTKHLHKEQLHTSYRPGGWNIQQIIHHLADNDMNAFVRFKRALTENEPEASSYREDLWAELNDYRDVPVQTSLMLLEALHTRFAILLRGMTEADFRRTLRTQVLGTITLDIALQRLVWHNLHHISHIQMIRGMR